MPKLESWSRVVHLYRVRTAGSLYLMHCQADEHFEPFNDRSIDRLTSIQDFCEMPSCREGNVAYRKPMVKKRDVPSCTPG
jgi:hypothetical protein